MKEKTMKVRDLIEQEICVDVYDDVCEEIEIALDGPVLLTDEGKFHFEEVLNYDIKLYDYGDFVNAIVCVDDEDPKAWRRKLKKASEFFYAQAGYCAWDDYEKWFKSEGI